MGGPIAKVKALQPPVMGLNYRNPPISLDAREALILDNILPRANHGELRAGYVEHVIGVPGQINTIASFIGAVPEDNKIFAFNTNGEIYDVTVAGEPPKLVITTAQLDGVWDFTNSTGLQENFLCMVSPAGGYYTYSKSEGFKQRDITGKGKDVKFKSIFNWKERLWLIGDDSCKAYYLGVGAIQGDAGEFDFAPVINQGGYLSYGCNWTYNAGYDMDDYLILVTTNGEVVVYKGSNPDSAETFGLQGVWFVGKPPKGNRCFTQFGGEMFIYSSLGVIPVSKLVNGGVANEYQVSSAKIQPLLNDVIMTYGAEFGWEMEMIYEQSFLLLKTPTKLNNTNTYYVMNVQTGAWGTISGMPMNCTTQVNNLVYFGTTDGKVCLAFNGDTDGASYARTPGRPIIGQYMGGFDDFETPAFQKTFQLARPVFFGSEGPSVAVKMMLDYESAFPSVDSGFSLDNGGRFDISKWNECVWAGGINTYTSWLGIEGLAYYAAFGMVFTGMAATKYITTNITYLEGGVM